MLTPDELSKLINEKGPDTAFLVLYQDYEPTVRHYIYHLLNNSKCSNPAIHGEDVVNDVWTNVKSVIIRQYHGESKHITIITPYLKTVAKNCCLKHFVICINKSEISLDIDDAENFLNLPTIAANAETELLEKEKLELVRSLLMEMTERERQILVFAASDISHEEVAKILNMTVKMSKVARFRAKQKIKQLLEKRGY